MKKLDENWVEWTESDLRFTGWEHECIIIDRTENHYFIPKNRYDEIMKEREEAKNKLPRVYEPGTGEAGCYGKTLPTGENIILGTYEKHN